MFFINIIRWLFDASASIIGPPKMISKVKDFEISGGIKIRTYKPNQDKSLPVLIFYHGGGWIVGSIKAYDRILRHLSYFSGCLVVAVEYRKAPKYKHPIAIHDSLRACSWILDNIEKLGGDIKDVGLMGDSAGGNIATFVAANPKFRFNYIILIYPVVNVTENELAKLGSNKYWLIKCSRWILDYCLKQYLSDKHKVEYILSPTFYIPKMLVVTAALDILSPTIENYISDMSKMGVTIELKSYSNTLHGFLNFSGISLQAMQALDDISEFIRTCQLN